MSYSVFIPTAGIGSRLGKITRNLNKSLVTVANRPVISHQIDKFPKNCEFVIALGFKGEIVKEFLELAYPNRKFFFVKVDPFEGPGSGLGKTLLLCKKYLQKPFVFLSCDTIIKENIIPPSYDWMAYSSIKDNDSYRTLSIFENKVLSINEKKTSSSKNSKSYIGLAGINNHSIFWKSMIEGKYQAIKQGEVYGLRSILKNNSIKAKAFTWNDTGNLKSLNKTRIIYRKKNEPNILDKENESIWFVGKNVIKFASDKKFIKNRVLRSRILGSYTPKVVSKHKNMYKYKSVDGKILSEVITLPLFRKLLNECKKFWKKENLSKKKEAEFIKTCRFFYENKTKERVNQFYRNFNKKDKKETINGELMPSLNDLFKLIDWDSISTGLAGRFHGDLHFENILWNKKIKKFTFIDWRQDFGGNLQFGDIYYDLAKLLHGLIVSHQIIIKNKFSINWFSEEIDFKLQRKKILIQCEKYLEEWCLINRFSIFKIRIITSIIFLNIAALHHYPYSLLLYSLGKKLLNKELNKKNYKK